MMGTIPIVIATQISSDGQKTPTGQYLPKIHIMEESSTGTVTQISHDG